MRDPREYAIQQYNLMIADMFDRLTLDEIRAGQPVINYFASKLQEHFAKEASSQPEKAGKS